MVKGSVGHVPCIEKEMESNFPVQCSLISEKSVALFEGSKASLPPTFLMI